MTKISHTLTSDNLPALLAPLTCSYCNGGGTVSDGHSNDPDARISECPECGGLGQVPYPGTFEDHRRDFASEVVDVIADALSKCAQTVRISFEPDRSHWHFTIGEKFKSLGGSGIEVSEYCQPQLHIAVDKALDSYETLVRPDPLAPTKAQLEADVAAFRLKRSLELSLPVANAS